MSILRIDQSASGANDGTSWTDAYDSLHTALTNVNNDDELWLKGDTYKPHATDRTISFEVTKRINIYGGFAGTETLRSERDPSTNISVLNGDIGTTSDDSDNSYHLICVCGDTIPAGSTLYFDGFDICNGNSNGDKALGYHRSPAICHHDFSGKIKLKDIDFTNNLGNGTGFQKSVKRYG